MQSSLHYPSLKALYSLWKLHHPTFTRSVSNFVSFVFSNFLENFQLTLETSIDTCTMFLHCYVSSTLS